MKLIKFQATQLRPGMFVAELDRPWLDTPFALQGFVVRDQADVKYVSRYVDHVFVDTEYTGSLMYLTHDGESTESAATTGLKLKAEFQQAKVSFDSAAETLDKVFESLSESQRADIASVKEAVNPLIEGVFRNQEAVAALLRLKEIGDYHYNHGISMALWAVILGRHLGLHRTELEKLAVGCAMCDVGMTQLPADLLGQSQELDDKQQRIIKAHPQIGAEMVSASDEVDIEILSIIQHHHERMDGSGYPDGIDGSKIPLLARIAGLADTYDAMITPRPYAAPRTSHEAVQELLDCKGMLFQESLVEQFVQAVGLFPTGTLVELNTGEVGIVVKQNNVRRLRPEIVVVLDENREKKEQLGMIDLADQDSEGEGERWIIRELLPGTYGVNSEEYFI